MYSLWGVLFTDAWYLSLEGVLQGGISKMLFLMVIWQNGKEHNELKAESEILKKSQNTNIKKSFELFREDFMQQQNKL